jgi:hypothetical protein
MGPGKNLEKIKQWCQSHPGIFSFREDAGTLTLRELYSQKDRTLKDTEIREVAVKQNSLKPNEDYLVILMELGLQWVLTAQGFAFPPDFTNTGPLPLPNQVYCLRDYQDLYEKLKWVSGEPERRREALDLVMILIALLDGARRVGLEVDQETRAVEAVLTGLEAGR